MRNDKPDILNIDFAYYTVGLFYLVNSRSLELQTALTDLRLQAVAK